MKKITIYLMGIISLFMVFQACDYNNFDNPPIDEPQALTPTNTINELKSMYASGGVVVNSDIIIAGKVISSDQEGNIYRSLYIQDNTGGIEIKINSSGLYNFYKEGQMVYLKCKNLKLGAYGGNISIGAVPVDNNYENDFIPSPIMENYIVKGAKENPVVPIVLKITELNKKYSNMLIKLNHVQFLESELKLNYADAENKLTRNIILTDKDGNRLVVRTSGYARFAGMQIAQGSGSITGILTYFNNTAQLIIIRLSDVQLNNPRF